MDNQLKFVLRRLGITVRDEGRDAKEPKTDVSPTIIVPIDSMASLLSPLPYGTVKSGSHGRPMLRW